MNVAQRQGFASIHEARKYLRRENRKYSKALTSLPEDKWPDSVLRGKHPPFAVWRSQDFLVQAFHEKDSIVRLSVSRTDLDRLGRWKDDISWDALQQIKSSVGYADLDAVEVYPSDDSVVNVANIRHLWILPEPIPWKWK